MSKDMASVVRRLLPEMQRIAPEADPQAWVEENWKRITDAAFGTMASELEILRERALRAGVYQVLSTDVDLLSPLAQEDREVVHTRALAYFLDPRASHGLAGEPLSLFLKHVLRTISTHENVERERELISSMLATANAAAVFAELSYELEAEDRGRTDLWIELPRDSPKHLLVVEMKVGMLGTSHQLGRYERAIDQRLAELRLSQTSAVKVFLSHEYFSPKKGWFALRWRNVAAALAPASLANTDGAMLLRFYLATLLRVLDGLCADPVTRLDKMRLRTFLRYSLERDA